MWIPDNDQFEFDNEEDYIAYVNGQSLREMELEE